MKIYTLTLNPAYDVHARADRFTPLYENFAQVTSRDAGGKGVNLSRALCAAGVENAPIVVIGRENGAEFQQSLAQHGLKAVYLEKDGRIRENLTLHHNGGETRISFSGFRVDDRLLDEVAAQIRVEGDTVVTFTGSIPEGISKEAAKAFLISLKEKGAKVVLDCRSFGLGDIRQVQPWLIKPNQQEASDWFGHPVESVEQAMECAEQLHQMGAQNAMISMGHMGAVLSCGQLLLAVPPKVNAVSTIGAGDSSLAGFLYGASDGRGSAECLSAAVAFGSAACMTEGTQPPRMEDITRILHNITVTEGK